MTDTEAESYWKCSIYNWYQNRKLAAITFPTQFAVVPEMLINSIVSSDGVKCSKNALVGFNSWSQEFLDNEWAGDYDSSSSSQEEGEMMEFHEQVTIMMKKWIKPRSDDGVFIKGFWNSAVDAYWLIPGGDNKCTTSDEILMLLQSSDLIREDLELYSDIAERVEKKRANNEQLGCFENFPKTYHFTLRKWHPVNDSMEFRCFVSDSKLTGICQRHLSNHWPYLSGMSSQISVNIEKFWLEKIKHNFSLSSYVFDVYIHSNGGVWLVDFSVFGGSRTSPLLWNWEELRDKDDGHVKFGLVKDDVNLIPNMKKLMSSVPYDLADEECLKSLDDAQISNLVQRMKKNFDFSH